ncbi:MAG: branched-chain-amino-acid transaminase [Elusimicrobiota bacterium]
MSGEPPAPDWDQLGFNLTATDAVYRAAGDAEAEPVWGADEFLPFGGVALSPAAAALSYGLGVFEGMKAERAADGRILLFRPEENARRLQRSAALFAMPPFPEDRFLRAVTGIVRRNERFIPPAGKGTLYIRPIELASEPMLGLRPAKRFELLIYASPVGAYFRSDAKGLRLRALECGRVAPGGSGAAKAMGNYPSGIMARTRWQREGYDDVLYLDARHRRYVTETSGSNVFARLRSGVLVTPRLDDQILPGITRASVIELARSELGWPVEERDLAIDEVMDDAVEVFCTGTAWTVRSVGEIDTGRRAAAFPDESARRRILTRLRGIQSGAGADDRGWSHEVAPE